MPICILRQQPVSRQHGLVLIGENIFTVCTAAGPIHEPVDFEGGRVSQFHADDLSHFPRQRLIFVSGRRAVEGQENAQTGGGGGVLAGTVHAIAAPKPFHAPQYVFCAARWYVVKVKG